MATQVKPVPEGMHTVTPHLVCAGVAEALEFYKKAFNAEETTRLTGANGKIVHAAMKVAGSTVMLADEAPDWGALSPRTLKGSPVTIHVYVEDVDAFAKRAAAAGAKITMPPENMFWGDRYGKLEDPFGHQWSIATHVRDVSPQEIAQAMKNMK